MTIDEAIKRLEVVKEGWPLSDSENYYKAVELGIGALKRIKDLRGGATHLINWGIEGETT